MSVRVEEEAQRMISSHHITSGHLGPICGLLPCTADIFFLLRCDKNYLFCSDDKAAVAGRAERDSTRAADLRAAMLRWQEADKSGEIPQSWQARVAALPPSLFWPHLDATSCKPGKPSPLGSQDLNPHDT